MKNAAGPDMQTPTFLGDERDDARAKRNGSA